MGKHELLTVILFVLLLAQPDLPLQSFIMTINGFPTVYRVGVFAHTLLRYTTPTLACFFMRKANQGRKITF